MTVPAFQGLFPSERGMNESQRAFYKRLVISLDQGEYLDVAGNISYVFVYLYGLLRSGNVDRAESVRDQLRAVGKLYRHEGKLASYCECWAAECLLATGQFEHYLRETEPAHVYGTAYHQSNLRLNLQSRVGWSAGVPDMVLLVGGRKGAFVVKMSGNTEHS